MTRWFRGPGASEIRMRPLAEARLWGIDRGKCQVGPASPATDLFVLITRMFFAFSRRVCDENAVGATPAEGSPVSRFVVPR